MQLHYRDHYDYKQNDLDEIKQKCAKLGINTIVTTEKDAVKLSSVNYQPLDIVVMHVEPEITKGEEVLTRRLASLYRD